MNKTVNKSSKKKTREITIILGTVVILVAVIVCVISINVMGAKKEDDTTTSAPTITTEIPTETTTLAPTTVNNETQKAPEISKAVPKSKAVENSYFNDAIFIGDSRTEGFFLYTGLTGAKMYAYKGLMVNTFFTEKLFMQNGTKVSMLDAIKSNKNFSKVYIMLGMNELGWGYPKLFIDKYTEIIKEIRKINPNAIIYIQSILPVTEKKSNEDITYNMKKINEFNTLLQKMSTDNSVHYLNVSEAVGTENGYLPADAAYDGVHLKAPYCNKWLEYLKTHTVG